MINNIRKFTGSWAAKIILGAVSLSFVLFWGISDIFRKLTNADKVVQVSGGGSVAIEDFQDRYQRNLQFLSKPLAEKFDEQKIQSLIIQHTLSTFVNELLLDIVNTKYEFLIKDEIVRYMISRDPRFMDQNGNFDDSIFNDFLKKNRVSEEQFIISLTSDIKTLLPRTLIDISVMMPKTMAELLKKAEEEKRFIRVYEIHPKTVKDFPMPEDSVLLDFFERNKSHMFVLPEYRTVDVVRFNEKNIKSDVSDKEIKDLYEKRKHEEGLEETFDEVKDNLKKEIEQDKSYIVLSDVTKAIEDKIKNAQDIKDILSKYSFIKSDNLTLNDKNKGVDGKTVIKDKFADQILVATFDTSINDEVSFVEVGEGEWILVKVRKVERARVLRYDEVDKKKIYQAWNAEKKLTIAEEMAKNLEKELNESKKSNKKYKDLDPLIRQDIMAIPSVINRDLFEKVFSMQQGQATFGLIKDHYVVVQLIKRELPDVTKEEVDEYRGYLRQSYISDMFSNIMSYYRTLYPVKINNNLLKMRVSDSADAANNEDPLVSDDEEDKD